MITDQLWLKQLNYPQSLVWIVKPRNAELRNWSMNKNSVYGFSLRLNTKKFKKWSEKIKTWIHARHGTRNHWTTMAFPNSFDIWRKDQRSQQAKPSQAKQSERVSKQSNNNDYLAGAECKTTFEPKLLAGLSVVFFYFTAAAAAAIVVVLAVVTSFSLFLDFERKGQLNLLGERALFYRQ